MSEPYNPFLRLTHLFTAAGVHRSTPLHIRPERIIEICDGEIYVEGKGSYIVAGKADELHAQVLAKLHENRQAETLGK